MLKQGRIIASAVTAAALAIPAVVWAADQEAAPMTDEERMKIEQDITKMGFTLVKIEAEDDEYEVYATRNQQLYEIEIDRQTGKVLDIEKED